MGAIRRLWSLGDHGAIWRAAKPRAEIAPASWFFGRFIVAADVVARRWGPRWSRERRLFGRAIGAWILLAVWLGVPLAVLVRRVMPIFF